MYIGEKRGSPFFEPWGVFTLSRGVSWFGGGGSIYKYRYGSVLPCLPSVASPLDLITLVRSSGRDVGLKPSAAARPGTPANFLSRSTTDEPLTLWCIQVIMLHGHVHTYLRNSTIFLLDLANTDRVVHQKVTNVELPNSVAFCGNFGHVLFGECVKLENFSVEWNVGRCKCAVTCGHMVDHDSNTALEESIQPQQNGWYGFWNYE